MPHPPRSGLRAAIADERDVNVEILNYKKSGEPFWAWTDDGKLRHASYKGLREKQDNAAV